MIKIEIDGEIIHLKKNKLFGWAVVHPYKNDDGTINWKNLIAGGSWIKLLFIAILVFLIVMSIVEYTGNMQYCAELIAEQSPVILNSPLLNFTIK